MIITIKDSRYSPRRYDCLFADHCGSSTYDFLINDCFYANCLDVLFLINVPNTHLTSGPTTNS